MHAFFFFGRWVVRRGGRPTSSAVNATGQRTNDPGRNSCVYATNLTGNRLYTVSEISEHVVGLFFVIEPLAVDRPPANRSEKHVYPQ